MKRVVIVGAGPCGLAALKEMLEGGHEAMLFERSGTLGGIFSSAAVYPNLHLTISNWAMSFSDFPDSTRLHYPSAQDYLAYLQSYARYFDLERHIAYHSEVFSATFGDDRQWFVQVKQLGESEQRTLNLRADALVVATGSNQVPNLLPPGLSRFDGRLIHSTEYSNSFKREVADKKLRVLVVGGGESGADVAAELSNLSPNVSVWMRRSPCVGPRYLNSKDEMKQLEANKTTDFPVTSYLEAASTNRMGTGLNVYAYGFARRISLYLPILNSTLRRLCLDGTSSAFFRTEQSQFVTKGERMCEALQAKKIEALITPSVTSCGRTCEFHMSDGESQQRDFDAIVLCTGFRYEFPWIQLPSKAIFSSNPRSWYLHCFPEGLGHCLFFVGYARPHQGGIPAMAEMLSRYIALLLRGQRSLPPDYAAQARRDEAASREYYFLSPNLNTLVDYNSFLESVARRVGCEPRLPLGCVLLFNFHILTVVLMALRFCCPDWILVNTWFVALLWAGSAMSFLVVKSGLLVQWWFYPQWPVWYRQRGPNAKPELLDTVLGRVNIWRSTAPTYDFALFAGWYIPAFYAQRLLSVFAFVVHVVLDAFGVRFREAWGGLLRPKLFALHDCPWRVSDLFLP